MSGTSNMELAHEVLDVLRKAGVRELCICPAARNAPWVAGTAGAETFKTWYFFDERAAAFFALGRIRNTGHPVAVITTSGTAVGELLPATMEAHYSSLPLILLTADRPRSYRGTGAPQSAEQVGILGVYVSHEFDFETIEELRQSEFLSLGLPAVAVPLQRPVHINVCFDEPLLP